MKSSDMDRKVVPAAWRFWVVSIAALLTIAITASLGVWQLSRAKQKLALQAHTEAQMRRPAWDTASLMAATDLSDAVHRRASVQGTWMAGTSVYLENRQMNGRNGFFLITALRLAGSDRAVLVQRGWVPRDFNDRTRVPAVPMPASEVRIEGRLAPSVGQLYALGETATGPIRQNITIEAYAHEIGVDLVGVLLLQTSPAPDSLLRDWPAVQVDVSRHYGYAFQWFSLSILAVFLYVWFQIIAPRRKRTVHGPNAR